MGFKCGIVGLPNVGKSTLFNALTATQSAEAANYPFCTIEPNVGRVAVEKNIDAFLELCGNVTVLPVTRELLLRATSIRRRYQVSHWDSTILAAAQELRCRTLHSEDLSHGQNFDGVRVVDPFR